MLLVEDLLVSDEVVTEYFACELNQCKGACCWEGDWGAPLDEEELPILNEIYPKIKNYLNPDAIARIEEGGTATYFDEMEQYGTALMPDGACVFLTFRSDGVAMCGIEKAWKDGIIDFPKPISCHLYPIRVLKNDLGEDYAINYDRWDICANACNKPNAAKIKLYEFSKNALIRRYGEEFFEQLDFLANLPPDKIH